VDMPAIHPAFCMFAEDEMAGIAIETLILLLFRFPGHYRRNSYPLSLFGWRLYPTALIAFDEKEQTGSCHKRYIWEIFFKHAAS
ncbi:MAG TPA: hypothetical protein PLQ40_08370, partial [Ferruginibacter sp.]|nr:hypothetical protein [Ferruginibacter sp.]